MTRAYNTATTQQNTGGAVAGVTAGKNAVINGNLGVWQRGTSLAITSTSSSFYGPDRWQVYRGATGSTVSRQVTGDTTNLPNIQYCARVQRDSANTSTTNINFIQNFESVNSIPFAGKAVTLSFYARAGANYSATSNALLAWLRSGTGTDQNFVVAYTGVNDVASGTATLTTTWQRFTFTGTVPTTATELAVQIQSNPIGTAGANDYFEITGVQVEAGSVATPFGMSTGTFATELAACQRYYQKTFDQGTTPGNAVTPNGQVYFTRQATSGTVEPSQFVKISPTMRTAPSVTLYNPYLSTAGQWSDGSTNSANARTINNSDSGITIDNTDTAITGQNFGIHYVLSAEL